MKTRNALIALAVAASALTGVATASQAASPAATAIAWHNRDDRGYDHRNGGWDNRGGGRHDDRSFAIENRIQNIGDRISDGRQRGNLSRYEARRLRDRLQDISSLKRAYERSGRGLSWEEAANLNNQLDNLSSQVRVERHDRNRW